MITETERDGVPVVFTPSPGPMAAGLVFRVGRADETLATSGVTHLIEHLALYRHGVADYHYNGTTESLLTHFHMRGCEADVVAYMAAVCAGLNDLPLDRLETEKAILRTEAAGHTRPSLPLWRYGAVGHGLVSYPEWGLNRLRPDEVRDWARAWFTRDNAVLWVTGAEIPSALRLDLPSGRRMPAPPLSSALPETPAFFVEGKGDIVFQSVVPRSRAAQVFSGVLERELYRNLRQEGGYSYTAAAGYDTRGDGTATVTAVADALPEQRHAALGGFIDVLAKLRVGRIEPEDIAGVKAKASEAYQHPDAEMARLPGYAVNLLTGQPNQSIEELRSDMAAVGTADVHAAAVDAIGSALLQVPCGTRADWAGFATAPTCSTATAEGTRYASRESGDVTMVVGGDAISVVTPEGPATVRYAECQAMLTWPDGARMLFGPDGVNVRVEPTLWYIHPETMLVVDARVPQPVVIPMPARGADAIPQPDPAAAATPNGGSGPATGAPAVSSSPARIFTLVALSVVAAVLLTCNGLATWGFAEDPTTTSDLWVGVAIGWLIFVGLLVPIVLVSRGLRRRR